MSKKAKHRDRPDRDAKRRQFHEPARRSVRGWWPAIAIVVGAVGLVIYGVASSVSEDGPGVAPAGLEAAQRMPVNAAGQVRIPLASLDDGRAKFFEYSAAHGSVRFFAMRGSDGVYRAALDACEICYSGRKGYSQRGDQMVCRKCGQSFASALINEASGGCHPIGVPRSVEGGELVINATDLARVDAEHASRASGATAAAY